MKFKMLNDWILLQEHKVEEQTTASGLIVGSEGLPQVGRATILFISPNVQKEFKEKDGVDLNVGDQVIFSKYQAEEIRIKDEEGKWIERTKTAYKFALQAKIYD